MAIRNREIRHAFRLRTLFVGRLADLNGVLLEFKPRNNLKTLNLRGDRLILLAIRPNSISIVRGTILERSRLENLELTP